MGVGVAGEHGAAAKTVLTGSRGSAAGRGGAASSTGLSLGRFAPAAANPSAFGDALLMLSWGNGPTATVEPRQDINAALTMAAMA